MDENAVCKGSYIFGTACGQCSKCKDEERKIREYNNTPVGEGVGDLTPDVINHYFQFKICPGCKKETFCQKSQKKDEPNWMCSECGTHFKAPIDLKNGLHERNKKENEKKKFKHTPGPWTYSKGHIGDKIADFVSCNRESYDGMHIHNGEKKFGVSSETSEANARLIAAAPDMLESIIETIKEFERLRSLSERLVDIVFLDGVLTILYSKFTGPIESATGEKIFNIIKGESND